MLALTAAAPTCDAKRTDSLRALSEGMKHYAEGRRSQALRDFTEATVIDETNDLAHYYTGLVSLHQFKDMGAARRHLKKAVDLDPKQVEYQYQYAAILQADRDHKAALAHLRTALAHNPKHGQVKYRIGVSLRAVGDSQSAARALDEAIRLTPRFDKAYVELGDLYLAAGFRAEAVQVLANCTQNAPSSAECHNEHGRALMATGKRRPAIQAFSLALARRPDHLGALFNMGMALRDEGDLAEAEAYLKQYLAGADRRREADRVSAAEQVVSGMAATQ